MESSKTRASPKLLTIAGLILIILGVSLTQYSERKGAKSINYSNTILTHKNSTILIDLGELQKGTHVDVYWMADPIVAFMMFKTGTREVIPTTTNPKSPHTGSKTIIVHSGGDFSPSSYLINETATYTLNVFFPDPDLILSEGGGTGTWSAEEAASADKIRLTFMKIEVLPPLTYPHTISGIGLASIGIIVFILGIFKSRR